MSQILNRSRRIFLAIIFFLLIVRTAEAVCNIPWGGSWTNTGTCTIAAGTVDGIDNGSASIPAGTSLIINGTFVFAPGDSILPTNPTGQITFGNAGQMRRTLVYYTDVDQDRYINPAGPVYLQSAQPAGTTRKKDVLGIDCNDNNAAINGGSTQTYYRDADGDGFGNPAISQQLCSAIPGWVLDNTDCDDTNPAIHGGSVVGYFDSDGDGYGDPLISQTFCGGLPAGWVADGSDCCDSDAGTHPGVSPQYDGMAGCGRGFDFDCSGSVEKDYDSYSTGCNTVHYWGCNTICSGGDHGLSTCSETTASTPNCGEYFTTAGTNCVGTPVSCPDGCPGWEWCAYFTPGITLRVGCH